MLCVLQAVQSLEIKRKPGPSPSATRHQGFVLPLSYPGQEAPCNSGHSLLWRPSVTSSSATGSGASTSSSHQQRYRTRRGRGRSRRSLLGWRTRHHGWWDRCGSDFGRRAVVSAYPGHARWPHRKRDRWSRRQVGNHDEWFSTPGEYLLPARQPRRTSGLVATGEIDHLVDFHTRQVC